MLSFSVNDYSDFGTAIPFHIVDMMCAEGEFTHVKRDILLGNSTPGIEFYHAIAFLFKCLEPLLFTPLSVFKTFGCLDVGVRLFDVLGFWLDFVEHGFS